MHLVWSFAPHNLFYFLTGAPISFYVIILLFTFLLSTVYLNIIIIVHVIHTTNKCIVQQQQFTTLYLTLQMENLYTYNHAQMREIHIFIINERVAW